MTAGFGLEKLGLLALRFPRATLLVIAAITVPLAYAAAKVGFSSDVREIFRSGTPDFINLQMVEQQYPESNEDILLLVQADDLFTADNLDRLRDLHLELNFVDGVKYVSSMFTAHYPPDPSGKVEPVFPLELREAALPTLRETVLGHPFVSGKLLSADATTALFVVAIEPQPDIEDLRVVTDALRDVAAKALAGTDLHVELSGVAFFRLEIVGALIRDQRNLMGAGFAVSLIICLLFFRSVIYACLAGVPAIIAVIWTMGFTQLSGQEVTVLTSVVPGLVIVLVVADSLHLLFSLKRDLARGDSVHDAIAASVNDIGPACELTSITTAIALLSLVIVPHTLVSGFGLIAAVGTAIAFLMAITLLPALASLLLRRTGPKTASDRGTDHIFEATSGLCERLGRLILRHPPACVAGGLVVAGVAGVLYAMITPSYQYRDYLPASSKASRAMEIVDEQLAGTEAMLVHIQWPESRTFATPETLDLIATVHETLERLPLVKKVVSLHSIETWATAGGLKKDEVFDFLKQADSPLIARMASFDNNSALVTGYFPAVDASELMPVLDALEERLAALRAAHPDVGIVATGIAPHSARSSYEMIVQLNRSLLMTIGLNVLLIGLVFWSLRAGLYTMLTNILPIAVVGAVLYLAGVGLQFTCVVAFTIGFGIAVDNAIHILNYYYLMRSKGQPVQSALEQTISKVGPPLSVSCVVLIAGFGGTLFSELPSLRLFGEVVTMLLATALFANLIVLPALIAVAEGRRAQPGGPTATP
jgi:predicted RND superfamily exporter protein